MKLVYFLIGAFIITFACKKETFYTGNDIQLRFSTDTVLFDTVFTGFGTATQRLMVYNPYDESVKISDVRLAKGDNSPYVININGSENEATNVILGPNDSMYVFVQILLEPNGSDFPVTIKDSVLFSSNGNQQDVKLITYAQDVNLFRNDTIGSQTWSGTKPYLIDGTLTLDSAETLYINPGVKVFMSRNANLVIKGNIQAIGNFYEPIIFRHNRFEKLYYDIPGQWGGIYIVPGNSHHRLEWVTIQNGTTGLQIGDEQNENFSSIDLSNVIIRDMAYSCLIAYRTNVFAVNCVFANAMFYSSYMAGGTYQFYHSTFANYFVYGSRKNNIPSVYISNYVTKENDQVENIGIDNSFLRNCIIYGTYWDELKLDFKKEAADNIVFDYCIIRKENTSEIPGKYLSSVKWNTEPKFKKVTRYLNDEYVTFEPDTLSPAKDAGFLDYGAFVPYDLNNKSRLMDSKPDLGAYERYEKEK